MFKKKNIYAWSEIWTRYLFVSIFIIILQHLGSTMIKNIFLIRRWSLDQSSYITKKKKIHGLIGINTNMIIKYNFTGRTQLNLNCQIQIYRNQHKYDDKILVIIIFLFNLQNRNEWLPTVSHVSLTSYAITNCTVSWPSVWLFLRNCCFIFILLTLYAYLENSMHLYIPCQRFD